MIRSRLVALILSGATALAAPALALEEWQIGHGPFVSASDVRAHNALGHDIADIRAALDGPEPRFEEAIEVYAFGRHFPWRDRTHSLGRFGDDYNGAIPGVLPASTAHFGTPSFQSAFAFGALAGTGPFQSATPAERAAAADGAALATVVNWTRFEVAMSERKALATEPNWSLENGSPKNWNEVFAFHHGPEGRHSVHEALEAAGEGAINEALYDALARGQEHVVEARWAPEEAAEVRRLIDRGALALLADALGETARAEGEAREAARARAAGLWRAAAEPVLAHDAAQAPAIEAALAREAPREAVEAAQAALAEVMEGMAAL